MFKNDRVGAIIAIMVMTIMTMILLFGGRL